MNEIVQDFRGWLSGLDPVLAVALASVLPPFELRLAIPVGIAHFGMPAWKAVSAAIVGNALAVTPVIICAKLYQNRLEQWRWSRWLLRWSLSRARRHERFVNRYGAVGLAVLGAIPLPGMGAWTGTAISILIGMRLLPTILAIYAGLVGAAAIVAGVTTGIISGAEMLP